MNNVVFLSHYRCSPRAVRDVAISLSRWIESNRDAICAEMTQEVAAATLLGRSPALEEVGLAWEGEDVPAGISESERVADMLAFLSADEEFSREDWTFFATDVDAPLTLLDLVAEAWLVAGLDEIEQMPSTPVAAREWLAQNDWSVRGRHSAAGDALRKAMTAVRMDTDSIIAASGILERPFNALIDAFQEGGGFYNLEGIIDEEERNCAASW